MAESWKFERARPENAREIFALYHSLIYIPHSTWSEHYPTREIVENDLIENDVRVLRNDTGRIVASIVLAEDDEIADIAPWYGDVSRWIEFFRLGVAAEYQNQGIARKMLEHAMHVSREKGYEAVRFLVAKSNPIAQRSYNKLRFDICGEHEMWGVGWLCYQKRL